MFILRGFYLHLNMVVLLHSVDFSSSVVAAMKQRATEQQKDGGKQTFDVIDDFNFDLFWEWMLGLQYIEMDARQLEFEDSSFDAAIDKGTIDAVLSDETGSGLANAEQICCEVMRYHFVEFHWLSSVSQICFLLQSPFCGWSLHCYLIDPRRLLSSTFFKILSSGGLPDTGHTLRRGR